jgi:hypothetical protein
MRVFVLAHLVAIFACFAAHAAPSVCDSLYAVKEKATRAAIVTAIGPLEVSPVSPQVDLESFKQALESEIKASPFIFSCASKSQLKQGLKNAIASAETNVLLTYYGYRVDPASLTYPQRVTIIKSFDAYKEQVESSVSDSVIQQWIDLIQN